MAGVPEFSVVLPVWNGAPFVAAAIESALGQIGASLEILAVDDGSTDATPRILSQFGSRIQVLGQPNAGVAAARNRGIGAARGHYVAFLDADDLWRPEKLARQREALQATPDARASATAFEVTDEDGRALGVRGGHAPEALLEALLCEGNLVGTPSSVVVERALLAQTGGFDPALSQCADWEMWMRLARATRFAWVRAPLVAYRQHPYNMSRGIPLLERDSIHALNKAFGDPGMPRALLALRRRAFGRNYRVLAGSYFQAGRMLDCLRCAIRAVGLAPRELVYIAALPWRRVARRHA